MLGDLIIFPMMKLGFDKKGDQKNVDRSWAGVKIFLESKLNELEKLMVNKKEPMCGRDKLEAARIEVINTVKNQMSKRQNTTHDQIKPVKKLSTSIHH